MNGLRRIVCVILCVCVCACGSLKLVAFADEENIPGKNDKRIDAIKTILSELSIMQGDPDGNMRYEDTVSRAEFTKIAVMASAYRDYVVKDIKMTVFPDVKGDNWAAAYVHTGVTNKMFSGYPDGTFKPDNTVLYEEAVNVLLRLLGYTSDDIGPVWPNGPVSLADNIGLDDEIDVYAGKELTRYDVAKLVYNMLKTSVANGNNDYIQSLGYSILEDTVLIACYEQDTSIGVKNIYTSAGTFELGGAMNKEDTGLRGDLVVKNNKTAICLIPSGQRKVSYTVTDTVGGGLMLDGKLFSIDENLSVYYGKQQYAYKNLYSLSINEGDKFSLIYTEDGFVDYALLEDKSKSYEFEEVEFGKYIVYSVVNNDIVFSRDGELITHNIPDSTSVYKDDVKMAYSSMKSQLKMGDVLYLSFKASGEIDYAKYEEGNIVGPMSAKNSAWQEAFGVDLSDVSVMRNGERASFEDITTDDVLYYCKDLKLVFAYYKKVTGVYEKALPNRDTPTSVVISGKTYMLEGIEAFNKLSSNGDLSLGDTITVLLGKDDEIADVMSKDEATTEIFGYLTETGTGTYTTEDNTKYTSFYVKVVLPDGEVAEYTTQKDYEDYINSVVRVVISGGKAVVGVYESSGGVSGTVSYKTREIGSTKVSEDVKILDIRTTDENKTAGYKNIFLQRIDGVFISEASVCYSSKNKNGEICELILNDVTGDSREYGVINESIIRNSSSGRIISGYKILTNDTTFQTDITGLGGLGVGVGVSVVAKGNAVETMAKLIKVENVFEITETKVIGKTTHTISDRVAVYKRSGSFSDGYTFDICDISDAVGIDKSRILSVYYDKTDSKGGRARVIVIEE